MTVAGWVLAGPAALAALAGSAGGVAVLLWRERRVRGEAVARACHELRAPITAVRLGLTLFERSGEVDPRRLAALEAELGRAALVLDDLTRAGSAGTVQRRRAPVRPDALERVALGPLLDEAINAAAGRAEAAGATVCGGWHGAGAVVWGDRLRLAQVLGNLVSNAVEHGGGQVRVSGELRGGRARVTVDDDGPGLPAPVAELARRPRAGRGARGRGLAIAVSIAEAHAGSLAAAPAARGGRIVLTLPARETGAAGSAGGR